MNPELISLAASSAEKPVTDQIQQHIDAMSRRGGGTVILPPGDHYTGTIRLKDNVILHIPSGSRIVGIADPDLYPDTRDERGIYTHRQFFRSLILARGVSNCGITGRGTICGQGDLFDGDISTERGKPRPKLVWFDDCENVTVRDVFLTRSGAWCMHLSLCRKVLVDGVRIHNVHQLNNDGIDIDSCSNVRVSNCDIDSEDDALCFKTLHHQPCEKIVVTNCILRSRCYAICIGSESLADFRDISVSNCVIHDTDRIGIGIDIHDGGAAENLIFSDIVMRNVDLPLFLRAVNDRWRLFTSEQSATGEPNSGAIRNILFSNFQVQTIPGAVGICEGLEEKPLENIRLDNWQVRFDGRIVPRRFTRENYKSQGDLRKQPAPAEGEVIEKTTDSSWGKYGFFFWERLEHLYQLGLEMTSGFFLAQARQFSFDRVRLDLTDQEARGPLAAVVNSQDVDTAGLIALNDPGCAGVSQHKAEIHYPEVSIE